MLFALLCLGDLCSTDKISEAKPNSTILMNGRVNSKYQKGDIVTLGPSENTVGIYCEMWWFIYGNDPGYT